MTIRSCGLHAATALLILAAASPVGLANPQAGAVSGTTSAPGQKAPQATDLSPIVVNGNAISLPTALQMIKDALARPWSTASADRYKIVCRVLHGASMTESTLHCETNAAHFSKHASLAGGGDSAQTSLTNAGMAMQLGQWVNNHVTNPAELEQTLRRLPPPGSSYTLRLTGKGRDTVDYVMDHGEVVAEYSVRNGKRVLIWSRDANGPAADSQTH